ncbi:MAG: MFS transporter, partial [Alphaproteobacteria bacterium]|nr:MFS transporter [Alphaproteobacteria bacterium]
DPVARRSIAVLFAGVGLSMLMAALDQTIVAAALSSIAADLGSVERLSWVVTAYLVASSATTLIYGRLSDILGRRVAMMASQGIFLAGSLLCGLAWSMDSLVAFRFLQGIGGGGLVAIAFAAIGDVIPPRQRGKYQGYIAALFAIGTISGPVLGGLLSEGPGWRWIFWVNLPIGLIALGLANHVLKRIPKPEARPRIDWGGAVLTAGSTILVLFLIERGAARGIDAIELVLGAGAVVAIAVTIAWERRVLQPVLPLPLFAVRDFALGVTLVTFNGMVMLGGITFLPLYLQLELGVSPARAGLLILPMVAMVSVSATINGRLISATGRYKALPVIGTTLAAGSYLWLALGVGADGGLARLMPALVAIGIGLGGVMPVMTVAVQNAVDRSELGAATASLSFARSLGGVIGVAVLGVLLAAAAPPGLAVDEVRALFAEGAARTVEAETVRSALLGGYRAVFGAAAAFAGIALLCALALPGRELRSS